MIENVINVSLYMKVCVMGNSALKCGNFNIQMRLSACLHFFEGGKGLQVVFGNSHLSVFLLKSTILSNFQYESNLKNVRKNAPFTRSAIRSSTPLQMEP